MNIETFDFASLSLERLRDRRSAKWSCYPPDVLPAWVAEMDFPLAPAVKQALSAAIERDDCGYAWPAGVAAAFVRRFAIGQEPGRHADFGHRSCYTGPRSGDPVPSPFGSCGNNGPLWYACEHPQRSCRAPLWAGSRLPAADPRGPASDSLGSLIDGARTVGAS